MGRQSARHVHSSRVRTGLHACLASSDPPSVRRLKRRGIVCRSLSQQVSELTGYKRTESIARLLNIIHRIVPAKTYDLMAHVLKDTLCPPPEWWRHLKWHKRTCARSASEKPRGAIS